MTLKGNVVLVLVFLIALIGSAGGTVFAGLQLLQGKELKVITADASSLEKADLPLLVAARDVQIEAFHLLMGHGRDGAKLEAAIGGARNLLDGGMVEIANLLAEIDRERLNPSPALVAAADRLVAVTDGLALGRVAKLNVDTVWLG